MGKCVGEASRALGVQQASWGSHDASPGSLWWVSLWSRTGQDAVSRIHVLSGPSSSTLLSPRGQSIFPFAESRCHPNCGGDRGGMGWVMGGWCTALGVGHLLPNLKLKTLTLTCLEQKVSMTLKQMPFKDKGKMIFLLFYFQL